MRRRTLQVKATPDHVSFLTEGQTSHLQWDRGWCFSSCRGPVCPSCADWFRSLLGEWPVTDWPERTFANLPPEFKPIFVKWWITRMVSHD